MSTIVLFIRVLLQYIAVLIGGHVVINAVINIFPKCLYGIRKLLKSSYQITVYVVCPRCDKLYDLSECITRLRNEDISKRCSHIEFPNHKYVSRRTKCDTTETNSNWW